MKQPPMLSGKKRVSLWMAIGLIVFFLFIVTIWTIHNRHSADHALSDLKTTGLYVDPPAPKSIVLGEGSDKGFSNVETTQNPTVAKVYAVSGQNPTVLITHYRQTYPSYGWHADYYYPSPGITGTDLVGSLGGKSVDVYIGSVPYAPQYPSLPLKQIGLSGDTTYVTVVLSERR